MMMIDKVKKYLLRHKEINVYKKNASGSEYFRVGNSIIRVSDHIPISNNQPDTLNIIVSGENFVVMYGNKFINVNDYESFKGFLKYHIQMCDCFKDIINNGLNRVSNDYLARERAKKKFSTKCPTVLSFSDGDVSLEKVPRGYWPGIWSMYQHGCFKGQRRSLIAHIQNQLKIDVE